MQVFSEQHLKVYLNQLFSIGMEQQIFRPELNPELLSNLLLAQTNAIIDTGLLNQTDVNFNDVYKMGFEYYLRGLLTEKGLPLLEAKLLNMAQPAV